MFLSQDQNELMLLTAALHPELNIGEEEVCGEQTDDDGREDDCHFTCK
jgi:hypothetical protein